MLTVADVKKRCTADSAERIVLRGAKTLLIIEEKGVPTLAVMLVAMCI